ncbi:transmembrane emp24 domain-containing protein 6-like [Anguilla anguilla]|uniref:transmembrane emp24 domain-containing protein 6-like n=1 Tax=Anguilla anguilla TaxID=7936 RepID=UPI0015B306ED|nr:transmembrane emp24 domain-containing protein 6-like [Anguilla anguilla]
MPGVLWYPLLLLLLGQGGRGQKSEPLVGAGGEDLFRGQDQYSFAIVLSGTEHQCFWHFAHQSGRFYLTYVVQWVTGVANNRHLSTTVSSPQGFLVTFTDDPIGHINFHTQETGFYQMCFSNLHNRFGRTQVFLSFGVYYEGFEQAQVNKEEAGKHLNDTLSTIEGSVNKLQGHIFHIWRHYNFARMRSGADHYLLLSNYNYVNWWSAAQSVVIVTAGYLQLSFLKKLFHTDNKRPRC